MKPISYSGRARRWRIERRAELRRRTIITARVTRVYRVDLEAMEVPEWAAAEAARSTVLRELSQSEWHVWLTRRSAKLLVQQAGGHAKLTEVEYRRCPQCDRILLGEDALQRRKLDESCVTGRQKPCGDSCFARQRRNKGPRAA